MKIISSIFVIFFISSVLIAKQPQPPEGYRYPKAADYTGDWKSFSKKIPTPFHVRADFNTDGIKDDAWILIRNNGKGYGLFVFLNQRNGSPQIIRLIKTESSPQRSGIVLAQRGIYKTACGKGYFACAPGEHESLKVNRDALNFFLYESAESIFYWKLRTKSFQQVRISD